MMKRNSESLGALMSMCPTAEEASPRGNRMYMLDGFDEEVCLEESIHGGEKKRRLSVEQVKALERSFEVENKLEPERKLKLAQELGLQPRQVAVWFQNRRARWKTKQLERDYGVLKASFDALKHNYDALQLDKDALLNEIKELKLKLNEEDINKESNSFIIKEESDNKVVFEPITSPPACQTEEEAKLKVVNNKSADQFKDGQSDSDSSAILNDDQSPNASNSSSGFVQNDQLSMSFRFSSSESSSINCYIDQNNVYHPQFVKMEEHNFFGVEEGCDFFSDEQAPTLQWDSSSYQWT